MTDRRKRKSLCQPRHRSCKINIRFLLSMKNKKPRSCIMIGTNQQIRGTTRLEKLCFSPLRIRDICGAMGNGRAPRRSLPSVAALRSALGSPFTAAPLPRFHRPRLAEKGLTPATPLPHRFGFSNSIYPSAGFVKSFFAFFQKKRGQALKGSLAQVQRAVAGTAASAKKHRFYKERRGGAFLFSVNGSKRKRR